MSAGSSAVAQVLDWVVMRAEESAQKVAAVLAGMLAETPAVKSACSWVLLSALEWAGWLDY